VFVSAHKNKKERRPNKARTLSPCFCALKKRVNVALGVHKCECLASSSLTASASAGIESRSSCSRSSTLTRSGSASRASSACAGHQGRSACRPLRPRGSRGRGSCSERSIQAFLGRANRSTPPSAGTRTPTSTAWTRSRCTCAATLIPFSSARGASARKNMGRRLSSASRRCWPQRSQRPSTSRRPCAPTLRRRSGRAGSPLARGGPTRTSTRRRSRWRPPCSG